MPATLVDAILGCIVGGAIGDAAGAAFEGVPGGAATAEHHQRWCATFGR